MPPCIGVSSPNCLARTTGVLLLVMAVAAGFSQGAVLSPLLAAGDAAGMSERLLASEGLFRAGVLGFLAAFVCDVPVAVSLGVLFDASGRVLALIMAAFRLVYAGAAGAILMFYFGAGLALDVGPASGLGVAQRQTLAHWSLHMFQSGFDLALVFFAFHLLLLGVLIRRSSLVPKLFGYLMGLAGLSYLVSGTLHILAPALHGQLLPVLTVPMMFELLLALWLLVKGVTLPPAVGNGQAVATSP